MTDDDLVKWTQKRIKVKEISEEKKNIYQNEVKNFNNFLEQNEIEYISIKHFLKMTKMIKYYFI